MKNLGGNNPPVSAKSNGLYNATSQIEPYNREIPGTPLPPNGSNHLFSQSNSNASVDKYWSQSNTQNIDRNPQ